MDIENTSDIEGILANPFYAVIFAPHIFRSQPKTAQEDWVLLNAHLIEDIGPKAWLQEFLDVVSLQKEEYDGHDIVDPSLAVKVSVRLEGAHPQLVTREQWIQANANRIKELGSAKWLQQLLEVLVTGGPKS